MVKPGHMDTEPFITTPKKVRLAVGMAFLFVVLGLCSSAPSARASSPVRWFGNDARSAAMAGSAVASGNGPSALYLNPALMTVDSGGIWMALSLAVNGLSIERDARDARFDVPPSIYDTQTTGWTIDRPLPTDSLRPREDTADLPTTKLLSLTAITSFLDELIQLGLSVSLPLSDWVSFDAWYNDEREQFFSNQLHFERFGEFDQVLAITPGVAFAPGSWLSIGVAFPIDLVLAMEAQLLLTDGAQWEYGYFNSGARLTPVVRPIVGLAFVTPVGLQFGLVYRRQSYADVAVDIDLQIWNGELISPETGEVQSHFGQHHRTVLGFKPMEIAAAAAFVKRSYSVEIGATFERWSKYLDRHGNQWTHPSWRADTTVPGWDDRWSDPTFEDVVSARLGGHWQPNPRFDLRAGVAYHPSPMPSLKGRYNYVDNTLLLYSLGVGVELGIFGRAITLDLTGQLWQMLGRDVSKNNFDEQSGGIIDEVPDDVVDFEGQPLDLPQPLQSNNPGMPGFSFGGVVFNGMVMIGVPFD